jgi:hypothetical protein
MGTDEATTRPTWPVTGVETGRGPTGCGGAVNRSDEAQRETPTAATAGARGTIRSIVRFISAPAAGR